MLKPVSCRDESTPMRAVLLVSCLLLVAPSATASSVTAEEWHYLQRVGLITKVNEQLWAAFEDSGGWNTELARYAEETTRLNVRSLRSWGAPVRPLLTFHSDLVSLLREMERFYGAVAETNFGQAHEIGGRIRREMVDLEASWQDVHRRYASPAARP